MKGTHGGHSLRDQFQDANAVSVNLLGYRGKMTCVRCEKRNLHELYRLFFKWDVEKPDYSKDNVDEM
jgi:hypothetical protein